MHRPFAAFAACALTTVAAMGCSGETTAAQDPNCSATTASVTATVTTGTSVVFDWTPRCAVALLLVEKDATDQWFIEAPGLSSNSDESANIILPPVTYGQAPQGAEQGPDPAAVLVSGTEYELILWKTVPAGSALQCQQRNGNACLLTVKAFTR
jgi:hypothetical protein